jgi:predicted O-methyltransferase YrrM
MGTRNYKFRSLKKRAGGMLGPAVYQKIYELCRQLPDLDIVEIGGAAGAGSISIAWAMKDSLKKAKLIVVEKCEGGSRSDIGGYSENLSLIEKNFETFGVQDKILLYPHEITLENGSDVISLIETREIAAFIHDADGRLDRDFSLFWPILMSGGLMIIDDYVDKATYKPTSDRYPQGGIKSVMTYRLLNQIIEWGLFEPYDKIKSTIFGYKSSSADYSLFNLDVCRDIIEEIQTERLYYLEKMEK